MSEFIRPPGEAIPIRLLSQALVATAVWPLFPTWLGRSIRPPFGMRQLELAAVGIAACIGYLIIEIRRNGPRRGVTRAGFTFAMITSLALLLGLFIEQSGNGYFTADALAEGLTVLLLAHTSVIVLRAGAGDGTALRSHTQSIVDVVLTGLALLMLGFWALATAGWHVPAGLILILLGGSYISLILFLVLHAGARARPARRGGVELARLAPRSRVTRSLFTGRGRSSHRFRKSSDAGDFT
jgi:hypothetical protein